MDTYEKFHDKGFEILGISLDSDRAALLRVSCTIGDPGSAGVVVAASLWDRGGGRE